MVSKIKKYLLFATIFLHSFTLLQADNSKNALVLSGGGARAFAHIGVLKALEEAGWYPDLIVGTSMGAIIGAMYSCGKTPDQIYRYLRQTPWDEILTSKRYRDIELISRKMIDIPSIFTLKIDDNFNIHYPRYILSTQGISERILPITLGPEYYSNSNFDSLAIPLRIVATNIKTGKSVVFKKGNLPRILAGSAAYPIVLSPVEVDSMLLVDGGLSNNVPCDVAEGENADFILAVNMSSKISDQTQLSATAYMDQTINTISYYSDTRNLHLADLLISPEITNIYSTDFDSIDVLVEAGYRETRKIIDQLPPSSQKPDSDYFKDSYASLKNKIVRHIEFKNNGHTRKHVLEGELEIDELVPLKLKSATRSVTNLYSTGIFNNVNLRLEKVNDDSIDVIMDLVEKPGSVLKFSANYNSEVNASALITFRMLNLFDAGIINNFSMHFNDYKQKISLDLISPRIFKTILTNSLNLHMQKIKYPIYSDYEKITENTVQSYGFSANLGLQIKRIGLTSIGINQLFYDVNENQAATPVIKENQFNVTRVFVKVNVDNTNDYDLPTRGNKNSIIYEQSLKNENLKPYLKFAATSRNYETYGDVTFCTLLHFGYLSSAPYYFEKFHIGGQDSFPGMGIYQKWGNMIFLSGLELRFPFTKGIYTNLQLKVGNVWDDLNAFNLTDFNWGLQAGLIIPTPIGPIRADYGGNIEEQHRFFFSLGHNF